MHSLSIQERSIVSRRLPIRSDNDDNSSTTMGSPLGRGAAPEIRIITTPLPDVVKMALDVDAPLELLSLEWKDASPAGATPSGRGKHRWTSGGARGGATSEHSLCLYTSKAVFVFQLTYDKENSVEGKVQGRVDAIREPFESVLFGSFEVSVIRVRPGPRQRLGDTMISPGQSLAVLVRNHELSEYSLVLSHSYRGSHPLTTPVVFGSELPDDREDAVVDFCFAQSRLLSALSSTTVLFLKASTDILAASPVVFHGSVVPNTAMEEAIQYLQSQLNSYDRTTPQWRQARVTQQYLKDVFRLSSGLFRTSVLFPAASCPPSVLWRAQVQGPVLFASRIHEEQDAFPSPALTLEPFGNSDYVGAAVARESRVDFAVLSPSAVLPRFTLETDRDRAELDDAVYKKSAWVERVAFGATPTNRWSEPSSLVLLQDPAMDTLLHYVTPKRVVTISTTVVQETSRRLQGKLADPTRTAAWQCLNAPGPHPLQGAVMDSTSAHDTHLVVRLSNGSVETVNVAEAQIRHQVHQALLATTSSSSRSQPNPPLLLTSGPSGINPRSASVSEQLSSSLESSQSLNELLDPLFRRIQIGLSGLTKVVGTATPVPDVTPDQLAVALEVFERCDSEIVLPLLEVKRIVRKRRERLSEVAERQMEQVKALKQTIQRATETTSALKERLERIESNAATLSQRSAAVLSACQSLLPTLSQAEYDYFQDVRRVANKTSALETKAKHSLESVERIRSKLQGQPMSLSLTDEQAQTMNDMLDEQATTIAKTQATMEKSQKALTALTEALNLNVHH
jgi:Nuclear pore component